MYATLSLFFLMSMATLVFSAGDAGYHECTYNIYRATCLNKTNPLNYASMELAEFPTIAGYTCVMLYNNRITQFPPDLTGAETVVTLNLQNNLIRRLPLDLTPMENLEILDLSANKMLSLSRQTRFPVSLRGLLLAENEMKTIPEGIEIPGLYVLDLSNNLFESVPEHFCVSDQLFRVDLTGNSISQDLSLAFPTLNRCRNIRNIPYCLFTNHEQLSCDCPTLAKVVGQKQRFCLGTPFRGREMKCKAGSSEIEYKDKYIFDINPDKIKSACSYALLDAEQANDEGRSGTLVVQSNMCMYSLMTIFVLSSFHV